MKTIQLRGLFMPQAVVIAVLVFAALTTRLLPLAISEYPFNNDGVTDSRIATDILESGHLEYPDGSFYIESHATITPAYNTLEAFVAATLGSTPYEIAQLCVGVFSIVTIVGGYLIALAICRSIKGAIAAALFLTLFGTFAFLTGSSWKAALGVALLVLLVYAFMHRYQKKMLILEILVLIVLVFVHHFVTFVAYVTLVYLTMWSLLFSIRNGRSLNRHNLIDVLTLAVPAVATYVYYSASSLDRLYLMSDVHGFAYMAISFAGVSVFWVWILSRRRHLRHTLAPIPSLALLVVFLWDYSSPLFPYESGYSAYIIFLAFAYVFLLFLAWIGFEGSVRSRAQYRAVPLGTLLPVVVIGLFALMSGFSLESHQILYRSFDFAGIAIALGIAVGLEHFRRRSRLQAAAVIGILVSLLVSFPFAYATDALVGIRHDTQQYEVDCLDWIQHSVGYSLIVESDERFSYNARAFYDYEKKPFLPTKLVEQAQLRTGFLYVYFNEWSDKGVNNYPDGHPIIDATYVELLLYGSNVLYIGGPQSDGMTVFCYSNLASSVT